MDAWQVAETVAFCFWRDRDISVEIADIQTAAPLSKVDDADIRRDLLGRNKFYVEQDVSMAAITVKSSSMNPLHFEDPIKRFGKEKADIWWQYASLNASGICSMLLVSALLGACADPNVLLSCDGDEIVDINICRGRYTGATKKIVVKDSSANAVGVFPMTNVHDWVCVRTASGKETCIDLAAAQYGDSNRSECSGVPVVFMPAETFGRNYTEEKRETDPISAYNEHFAAMLNARTQLGAGTLTGEGTFATGEGPGRMEEFFSVLGKSCAILGLV